VLVAALFLLLIISLLGECVAPYARDYALRMKGQALSQGQSLNTRNGTWVRDHDQFIHINKIVSVNQLQDITRYQFSSDHRLLVASYAQQAKLEHGQWVFYDVVQSEFQSNKVLTQKFATQSWPMKLRTEEMLLSEVDPHQQSLVTLYHYLHFRRHSGLGVGPYAFSFWKRIFQPIATLVMILLAIPVVFGPLRTVSMGLRILTGVVMGFSFYILNQFLGPFSLVYQVPPFIAAAFPTVLFALIATFLLKFRA